MSMWNKYGQITRDGRISVNLKCTEEHVDYAGAHKVWTSEPSGNKFDVPAVAAIVKGRPMIVINGVPCGYLPMDWTQFFGQVRARGPIDGLGRVSWDGTGFTVGIKIDET